MSTETFNLITNHNNITYALCDQYQVKEIGNTFLNRGVHILK
jgi:hypothetical protein